MHVLVGLLMVALAVVSAREFDGIRLGVLGPLGTLLLVGIGPVGAVVMSHDWRAIVNAFRCLAEAVKGGAAKKRKRTLSDCYQVGRALKGGRASEAAALLERSPDPLLNACAPLLLQKTEGEDLSDTVASLSFERLTEIRGAEELFGSLAQSAPAFGLIGTVLGLVDMLRALKDFERLGPSMALAVMSTFYGLVLSQVLFVPLAKIIERHGQDTSVTGELLGRALHAIAEGRALSAVRVLGASRWGTEPERSMRRRRTSWAEMRGSGPADLWLISYSDMLTLLLAFFTLILSVAQVGKRDFEKLRAAINNRTSAPSDDQLNRLAKAVDEWAKREHLSQHVATSLDHNGLRVQFANTLLFDSGRANIDAGREQVLLRFIEMFRSLDPVYHIAVEGYSDDVPINNPQFRSNWALSSARAVEVLERFIGRGIAKERVSVEAFADTRPVDAAPPPLMSPAEKKDFIRSLNRRVIIRVY